MNKFIKEQLNKIKIAEVPDYSESDGKIIFKRKDIPVNLSFVLGKAYHIKLADYIIHPYDGFTLHSNWNNDIVPTDNEMNVEVIQIMGKMVKIRGIGIHDSKFWTGWIPIKSADILEVI